MTTSEILRNIVGKQGKGGRVLINAVPIKGTFPK